MEPIYENAWNNMIPSTEEFERLLKLGGIGENTIQDWYKEPTKFQDSFCAAVRIPNLSARFSFVSSLTSKALNTQCYFLFAGEELRYDYKNQFQPRTGVRQRVAGNFSTMFPRMGVFSSRTT